MLSADRTCVWIVVAALDESPSIARVVRALVLAGWRVVVVDDGSADDTAAIARAAGADVLRHVVNLGQGAALQTGIDHALARGARAIVTFDADGQHDPADVAALIAALDAGNDVALGSRFLGRVEGASPSRVRLLRAAVMISNLLAGLSLSDAHCGLRAFRAESAARLRITQPAMAHASELLARIREHRLRYAEVPVTIRYTDHSIRKGQRAIDGVRILADHLLRPAAR